MESLSCIRSTLRATSGRSKTSPLGNLSVACVRAAKLDRSVLGVWFDGHGLECFDVSILSLYHGIWMDHEKSLPVMEWKNKNTCHRVFGSFLGCATIRIVD